jgi:putative SOS response-associated peptidase YedK
MCGRFSLVDNREELSNQFHLKRQVTIAPRYNIAPSQQIIIIRSGTNGNTTSSVRWGLIPHWSKDEKFSAKLINARAETVQEKPVFREAFKERRCLIPANGFYEWKNEGNRKQPYFIKMKNGRLFAMAGICEYWQSPAGETIESCAIITTEANTIVGKIHDRMPVIIPETAYGLWLDPVRNGDHFREYFQPFDPFKMTAYPVSGMVNYVKNEGEGCIRKIDW